jgi:hypothetical protein
MSYLDRVFENESEVIVIPNAVRFTGAVTYAGAVTMSGSVGAASLFTASAGIKVINDQTLVLGTTVTTAETKISLKFDETTTGIGLFEMGSSSAPMVLNTNPGDTIAHTINVLHSAGAGNCDNLVGSYAKVAVSGAGDSGLTMVGSAPRAYVLAGAAGEVYGCQPWAKHVGTGTVTAMSALSAALLLNDAEAFTATNSINAGHFHIKPVTSAANGTITSGNFDGVMVEVYTNVTGMRSLINLSNAGTSTVSMIRMAVGACTSVFNIPTEVIGVASDSNGSILADISATANAGYIRFDVNGTERYLPLYAKKTT